MERMAAVAAGDPLGQVARLAVPMVKPFGGVGEVEGDEMAFVGRQHDCLRPDPGDSLVQRYVRIGRTSGRKLGCSSSRTLATETGARSQHPRQRPGYRVRSPPRSRGRASAFQRIPAGQAPRNTRHANDVLVLVAGDDPQAPALHRPDDSGGAGRERDQRVSCLTQGHDERALSGELRGQDIAGAELSRQTRHKPGRQQKLERDRVPADRYVLSPDPTTRLTRRG